jgi:hypothetical protein
MKAPIWEVAFVHAVLANAARAAGETALYTSEYALAKRLARGIADQEEREIFEASFAQIPVPQVTG